MIKFARVNLVLALAGVAVAVAACGGSAPAPASQAAAAPTPVASRTASPTLTPMQVAAASSPSGVMVDSRGMTVYSYDRDQATRSACTGRCAQTWRPVVAQANAPHSQEWTTVRRADGSQQWAYQGRPLYTWARDQRAGDMNGDGMDNGQWHVMRR